MTALAFAYLCQLPFHMGHKHECLQMEQTRELMELGGGTALNKEGKLNMQFCDRLNDRKG